MRKVSLIPIALAACGLLVAAAGAQETGKAAKAAVSTTPTIDQSLEWKSAFNPRISPDGKRVVYEVQKANWEDNAFDRNLWIVDIATGESHALTSAKKSSTNPAWSPDGKWIAFLSDRPGQIKDTPEGKKQLYFISADGGEAQQLTKVENDVNAFDWAPDSKRIAFSMTDPDPKTLKDRKEKYGEYSVVHADYQMTHLWTIEISNPAAAAEPKRLTDGDKFSVGEFSWSPDGTRIAFSAQNDPDLISSETADLYLVTVNDGAVKKIVSTPGPDTNPKWSPDGKRIAFETAAGAKYYYYTKQKIAVVPAEGGAPQILTEAFDEDPGLIGWGPDGIYFAAEQKTYAHFFRLNPATKAVEKLSAPDHMASFSFSFSRDYKQVAYRSALENQYAEIYSSNVVPWQGKKLTAMGDQLKGFTLARREVISWKSADGTTIEGVVYKPAGLQSKEKISIARGHPRRPYGSGSADCEPGPLLSDRALRSQRSPGTAAELPRLRGLRRKIPRAERPQSRCRGLCRRDFRS